MLRAIAVLAVGLLWAPASEATDEAVAKPPPKAFAVIQVLRGAVLSYEAVAIPDKKGRMQDLRKAAQTEIKA